MRTDIYLHYGKYLCAIVKAEEGYKFVDNIERFCPDWRVLIEEAKKGFEGFPFYDRYKNYDVDFWDRYLEITEGGDDDYELLGGVDDGVICFPAESLENKGEFFIPLLNAMRVSEAYDFGDIRDIVCTDNYIVLSSGYEVMACSKIKIPFEPNREQVAFRKLLQSKLKALQPFEEQVLYARYGCALSQDTDVENALFYNIGAASFGAAACKETSVYFQRMQPNEVCGCESWEFQYLYHYSKEPKEKQRYWWEKELVCEWNNIILGKINSNSKALDYFLAIKTHSNLVKCVKEEKGRTLGLKIRLFIPKETKISNIVSIMKPMIDGVICAFHTPDSQIKTKEVSERLNIDEEVFLSSERTCLGKRCYVRPYNVSPRSVKWDPQDERLDYVFIEPVIVDDDEFSFSGEIFAVPCYM